MLFLKFSQSDERVTSEMKFRCTAEYMIRLVSLNISFRFLKAGRQVLQTLGDSPNPHKWRICRKHKEIHARSRLYIKSATSFRQR
jgi:hypothetical protein